MSQCERVWKLLLILASAQPWPPPRNSQGFSVDALLSHCLGHNDIYCTRESHCLGHNDIHCTRETRMILFLLLMCYCKCNCNLVNSIAMSLPFLTPPPGGLLESDYDALASIIAITTSQLLHTSG